MSTTGLTALAAAGPSAYWYLARGTGAVSLILLSLSVILGIAGPLRATPGPRWPRFAVDTLHRDVSLLVIVLLVLHIITSVLDGFAPIGLIDAVIPLHSSYRPLWLGLGALSFDLLVALVITSLARVRLGYRPWRAVHWLAYLSWPVAVLHGLGTGSDTKQWWMLAITFGCLAAVLVAVLLRIARSAPVPEGIRAISTSLAVVGPVGIAVFTLLGPLGAGWARRAGTPASLLPAPTAPATSSARPAAGPPDPVGRSFTSSVSGTVSQQPAAGGAIVDLDLTLHGQVAGRLRVRLGGAPLPGGGLSLTGSQVDLSAVGTASTLGGHIVSLQGDRFIARVSDHSGTLQLDAALNIDSGRQTVSGTLTGQPLGGAP